MTDTPPDTLEPYLAQAATWAHDRQEMLLTSRRNARRAAAGIGVIAVCEAIALVALLPLKTVIPYTLLVDRQTGYVEALRPLDARTITADAALTRSFLVQYVIAREGFAVDSVQADYRKVALWSAGDARAQYLAAMQPSGLESPLARYPRSTVIDVVVKSVTSLSVSSAMVRYEVRRIDAGGQMSAPTPWVAVVHFTYSGEPMSVADRMINPLGFKVTRYRRSAEAVAADMPATTYPPSATLPIRQPPVTVRRPAVVAPGATIVLPERSRRDVERLGASRQLDR